MDSKKVERKGQGLVEYALIMVLVVIVGMIGLFFFGPAVKQTYAQIVEEVDATHASPAGFRIEGGSYDSTARTFTLTWTEAPRAQSYAIEFKNMAGTTTMPVQTYDADAVCNNGLCQVTVTGWPGGKHVHITAINNPGTITIRKWF